MVGEDEEAGIAQRHVHIPGAGAHHIGGERHAEHQANDILHTIEEVGGPELLEHDEQHKADGRRYHVGHHGHDKFLLLDAVVGAETEEEPAVGIEPHDVGPVVEGEDDGQKKEPSHDRPLATQLDEGVDQEVDKG